MSIKQAQFKRDERPIDPDCGCPVCKHYSRAYLHHLFNVKEMLGARLNTIHNLWYFADLMQRVRSSIERGTFLTMREEFYRARAEAERVGGATAVAAQEPRAGLD